MLDHIHIQNYRLFKDLKIDKLGQVNLIAGKNNTGKTALLEALRILESDARGVGTVINNIIYNRGGWQFENRDFESYLSLFNEKKEINNHFLINHLRFGILESENGQFLMYAVNYKSEPTSITFGKGAGHLNPKDNIFYIAFNADTSDFIPNFDKIALSYLEKDVIKILQLINPHITNYKILIANKEIQIEQRGLFNPIKEEGDGLKRLLLIAAGLVLSKDKILLIDEFEVGLHHSVQKQLWEIIFKYAKEWNIQVFATTHSQDTIENFYYVADRSENKGMGNYFILNKRKDEDVKAINFDFEEMKLAIETNVELR
jgi:predicted ATPase